MVVGGLFFGGVVIWAIYRDRRRKTTWKKKPAGGADDSPQQLWREALRGPARALGLRHSEESTVFDHARGTVGGLDVHLMKTRTIITGGGDAWPTFRKRKSADGPGMLTGDAAFDASIYIEGANAAHRGALADAALRDLIRHLVIDLDLEGRAHQLFLPRRDGEITPEAISEPLEPLLKFARWLLRPHAPLVERGAARAPLRELDELRGEKRADTIRSWLQKVGPSIAAGELVARQDAIEWRGPLGDLPFRVRVDEFDDVMLEVKVPNPTGDFALSFDPSAVPQAGASDAWDEADQTVVFVGPGIFFDGESREVDAQVQAWSRLAEPSRERVIETMRESDLGTLSVEGGLLSAALRDGLASMRDPDAQLSRASSGLAELGAALAALPARPSDAESSTPWQRANCRYCRTVFVWSTKSACPNCGASIQNAG